MTVWASTILLAPNNDSSLCCSVDYQPLNVITVQDNYSLPRMEECIDSLGEATIVSTLDSNSGYLQIEIDPKDRGKTTFTSHHG